MKNEFIRKLTANTFTVGLESINDQMINYVKNFSINNFTNCVIDKAKNWDEYYFNIAKAVASNSKCLSRKIGSILVQDKSIVGTGYNGPPRGIIECSYRHKVDIDLLSMYKTVDPHFDRETKVNRCPRRVLGFKSGAGLEWCVAGHSERNCLINSARNGIATKGGVMYLTCNIPCSQCLVEIINAGISEVVVTSFELYDVSSKFLIEQSNLKIRMYNF